MSVDYASLDPDELKRAEKAVADRHLNRFPTLMVIWTFANLLCWLCLWPLVLMQLLPLWLAFLMATVNFALFYLPSHEAQHSIIARPGEGLRWLNELVGHISSIPMAVPFRVFRDTHMEHHKYANDPERDPDYGVHAATAAGAIWASIQSKQPRPLAPHSPGLGVGRYQDTRSFRSKLGNIGSMGMQYHIIHHLYPRIPLTRTPAAYREMKPVLEARGCEVHAL